MIAIFLGKNGRELRYALARGLNRCEIASPPASLEAQRAQRYTEVYIQLGANIKLFANLSFLAFLR
tara:strand:- start:284 stop:481 length:198 start_codon:yes stop_codon:yes gene_type:complete